MIYSMFYFYTCPKCGKENGSWDGVIYCAICEPVFQKEQDKLRKLYHNQWQREQNE